jgi:hypothetical protein
MVYTWIGIGTRGTRVNTSNNSSSTNRVSFHSTLLGVLCLSLPISSRQAFLLTGKGKYGNQIR